MTTAPVNPNADSEIAEIPAIADIPLTITELALLVARLDFPHYHPTRRQLRSWCRTFEIGIGKTMSAHNGVHLYTGADLAITRLILRLRRRGVSERTIWALVVSRKAELRAALNVRPYPVVWIEENGCPLIVPRSTAQVKSRHCFRLSDCMRGIRQAIDSLRATSPTVWNGATRIPIAEFVAST